MNRSVVILAAATLATSLACGEALEPAAAVVDGSKITTKEVQDEVERFRESPPFDQLAQQSDPQTVERDVEQGYLALLIRGAVLEGEARERGIEVTAEDVEARLDELKAELGSETAFEQALKQEGLSLKQLEFRVRIQLLEEELREEVTAEVGPGEEKLRAYYQSHIEDYQLSRPQHILVREKSLALDIARQLEQAKPKEVESLFEKLAKKHSEDPGTAAKGGDLGLGPSGQYTPPFENALEKLRVGEISDPVETEFGYHIIRLVERSVTPFEEAKPQVEQALGGPDKEAIFQEWLVDAYREADIEVNPRYGELKLTTQQIEDATAEDVPGAEAPKTPKPKAPVPAPLPPPAP